MIDISEDVCKSCGHKIEQMPGHRRRLFCSDTCRQRSHRANKSMAEDQQAVPLAELAKLRAKVTDQAQAIEELEQENTQLKKRLDFERRFLEDMGAYTFKAWLRKQPASLLRDTLIADQTIPPKTSRAMYQAHVQRLAPDLMEEFIRLWKLMLLSRA